MRSLLNAILLLCYCFREHSSRITSTYCRRFKSNPQYLFLLLSAFASAFELSSVLLASRSQKNRYLLNPLGNSFFPSWGHRTVRYNPSEVFLLKKKLCSTTLTLELSPESSSHGFKYQALLVKGMTLTKKKFHQYLVMLNMTRGYSLKFFLILSLYFAVYER